MRNRLLKNLLAALILIAAAAGGASAKDSNRNSTAVFTVTPQITCQNCEKKIKSNLRFEKGISNIVTDLKEKTITITYDPAKTDTTAIVKAFKKIGYTATTRPEAK